ncbi:MAG: hypothetical protein ACYTXI_06980 [Nostoc sp.]
MGIRNEVTYRLFSKVTIPGAGANQIQRLGEIESEANVRGNSQNMQTDLR